MAATTLASAKSTMMPLPRIAPAACTQRSRSFSMFCLLNLTLPVQCITCPRRIAGRTRLEDARVALTRLVTLRPNDIEARDELGALFLEMHKPELATAELARSTALKKRRTAEGRGPNGLEGLIP
jgi:hypothetical protein